MTANTGDDAVRVGRLLDGTLSLAEHQQLVDEIAKSPSLADEVVRSLIVDDLLAEHAEARHDSAHASWMTAFVAGENVPYSNASAAPRVSRRSRWVGGIALALVLLGLWGVRRFSAEIRDGMVKFSVAYFGGKVQTNYVPVARVARSVNVEWGKDQRRWSVGDRIYSGEELVLNAGRLEVIFDSGAVMTLVGPAGLRLRSPTFVELSHGTTTTRADYTVRREFRIVTPVAEVVDLGTEFGVRMQPDEGAEIVVFEGIVELIPVSRDGERKDYSRRLMAGQAVKVDRSGKVERLVAVTRDTYPAGDGMYHVQLSRPPVIAGISDNLRSPSSKKFYQIQHGALREDAKTHVDRTFEWNGVTTEGIPRFLLGADYVMTFNDDKDQECPLITVNVSCPCDLYVLYDNRMEIPEWLQRDFSDTGAVIGIDEGQLSLEKGPGRGIDRICMVWRRRLYEAGSYTLGPVGEELVPSSDDSQPSQRTMFGIAAQPVLAD
ncbi:FecR domain-containing protein [Planctomicrobium sp. SH664]|uniref:FecR domain-containing protein n=1 Tax=Planctomicrobium sp. SH664 TaxID=3448125 RepID=UPI003F5B8C7D